MNPAKIVIREVQGTGGPGFHHNRVGAPFLRVLCEGRGNRNPCASFVDDAAAV